MMPVFVSVSPQLFFPFIYAVMSFSKLSFLLPVFSWSFFKDSNLTRTWEPSSHQVCAGLHVQEPNRVCVTLRLLAFLLFVYYIFKSCHPWNLKLIWGAPTGARKINQREAKLVPILVYEFESLCAFWIWFQMIVFHTAIITL